MVCLHSRDEAPLARKEPLEERIRALRASMDDQCASLNKMIEQCKEHRQIIGELFQNQRVQLDILKPLAGRIRLKAMKDLLLGCLGLSESQLSAATELSQTARDFWATDWPNYIHPALVRKSILRKIDEGTIERTARIQGDAEFIMSLDPDDVADATEGFKIIYFKPPSFYLENPGFGPLADFYSIIRNNLSSAKADAKDPEAAMRLRNIVQMLLCAPNPPSNSILTKLCKRINAALF
ncbi:hypothetical protein TWF481_003868 [Arthrobotrys musiformis]|uniref:Uncharacterized protein n=1 Tax=Arthrobotrys musiformis TaxID=47236 RepID=A0AAV9WIC2_9PEZI